MSRHVCEVAGKSSSPSALPLRAVRLSKGARVVVRTVLKCEEEALVFGFDSVHVEELGLKFLIV